GDGTTALSNVFSMGVGTTGFVIAVSPNVNGKVHDPLAIVPSGLLDNQTVNQHVRWHMTDALPPGLTFDSESGRISGAPTTPGNWTVRIQAFYGELDAISAPVSIRISDRSTLTVSVPLQHSGRPGVPMT